MPRHQIRVRRVQYDHRMRPEWSRVAALLSVTSLTLGSFTFGIGIRSSSIAAAPGIILSTQVVRGQIVGGLPIRITVAVPALLTRGQPVTFTGTLENLRDRTTQLILGDAKDFSVYDSAGELVWDCYFNAAFLAIAREITLGPLEKQTMSCNWNLVNNDGTTIKPGRYTVEASYGTDDRQVEFTYRSERRAFWVR